MTRSPVAVLAHCVVVAVFSIVSPVTAQTTKGILLLAHGGSSAWNTNVTAIAAETNRILPTEVAFGMADRSAMALAIDRLKERGVKDIVAVPLFVSSYSSVLTSTEYLLGLRADKPAAVEIFARMRHGSGGGSGHEAHQAASVPQAPTLPIDVGVPVKMTSALDAHPIVGEIVIDRALAMSRQPDRESVILVAHGPNEEADDIKWRQSLTALSQSISQAVKFAHVEGLTVRDDAPAPIKQAATEALRAKVSGEIARGRRVLIVPVLLSYGGIEAGVRERLAGLSYEMSDKALAPESEAHRLGARESAGSRRGRPPPDTRAAQRGARPERGGWGPRALK